jgi:hypothetical protein
MTLGLTGQLFLKKGPKSMETEGYFIVGTQTAREVAEAEKAAEKTEEKEDEE